MDSQRGLTTSQSDGLGFLYGEGSTGAGGPEGRGYGSERIGRGRYVGSYGGL